MRPVQNISTFQPHRWREIVADRIQKGREPDLSEHVVMEMMRSIHEEAIRQQEMDRIQSEGSFFQTVGKDRFSG